MTWLYFLVTASCCTVVGFKFCSSYVILTKRAMKYFFNSLFVLGKIELLILLYHPPVFVAIYFELNQVAYICAISAVVSKFAIVRRVKTC